MAGKIDITLTWTTAEGTYEVDRWEVYRDLDGAGFEQVADVTAPLYVDEELDIGSTAVYRVIAYDIFGAASSNSNTYTKTTTLVSPVVSVLSSDLVGVTATLTWTASAAGTFSIKDYLVQRDLNGAGYTTLATVLAADTREYVDTLALSDSADYRIVTRDFYDNATNSNVETETVGPLSAPVLSGTTIDFAVSLSWTASSGPLAIDDYQVQRNLNGAGYLLFATVDGAAPRVAVDTLAANDTAMYRVRALDAGANLSAFSNVETEVPSDPFYASNVLLLHMNGANGGTTFTDNSPTPKTMTATGAAVTSTAQAKFGTASFLAPTGGAVTTPDSVAFDFSTGDWTIEGWVYKSNVGTLVVVRKKNFSSVFAYDMQVTTQVEVEGARGDGTTAYSLVGTFPGNNQWVHIALTRSGNVMRLFVNGVLQSSSTLAVGFTTLADNAGALSIGSSIDPSLGYIDDLRMTKGVARYTANFAPPTQQFLDS